ncbi:hypothetical protein B566_EDAN017887 [Ephemera danica]|nr:hypothetical protein B566_EDAN017887 [Ephemera danica]
MVVVQAHIWRYPQQISRNRLEFKFRRSVRDIEYEYDNEVLTTSILQATVRDVMRGERILITGATGTVGSVLLEKLLRCCPEIDTIFVLLRSKDGCDVRERLHKLFTSPLYAAVPVPVRTKVVALQGDVSLPDLGLSAQDRDILVHHVGIVLHCAANVSFGAGLRSAVNANLNGSKLLGTWKEPFPGWLPIGYGASGFIAGTGKGVFRTVPASPKKIADLVPSDVVVNAIIAAAWGLAQPGAKQLQIYHVTSSTRNPVTWGEYTSHVVRAWRDEFPCKALAWVPDCKCRPEVWRNRLVFRLCQLWPSYLVDFVEANTAASHNRHKKESLVSVQRRFIRGMELMSHFSQRQWSFHSPNLCELHKKLSPEDQATFSVELLDVDWGKFINACVLNVRQHFFKDPIATLPQAKTYIRR